MTTPGPYRLSDRTYGYSVLGKGDVPIAWFCTAMVSGKNGHRITLKEAKANAQLFLRALNAQKRKRKP